MHDTNTVDNIIAEIPVDFKTSNDLRKKYNRNVRKRTMKLRKALHITQIKYIRPRTLKRKIDKLEKRQLMLEKVTQRVKQPEALIKNKCQKNKNQLQKLKNKLEGKHG